MINFDNLEITKGRRIIVETNIRLGNHLYNVDSIYNTVK